MYDFKYSFSDYRNVRKYYDLSFMTKHDKLSSFYYQLNEFRNLVLQKKQSKKKQKTKNKKKTECTKKP